MENYYLLEDSKYYGILKHTTLTNDDFSFQKLISMGLYVENGDSLFKTIESYQFDAFITLESGKTYRLRDEVYEDIYQALEYSIENIEDDVLFAIFDIKIELEALLDRNEKIRFLKNYYYNLFQEHKGDTSFMTYMGINQGPINDFGDWKNEALYILSYESTFLLNFLKGEKIILTDLILYENWKKFYTIKELAIHCKSELNKLESTSDKSKSNCNTDIEASKKVLLFEKLMKVENWEGVSATKKGEVLTYIFSRNPDNIKTIYLQLEKKLPDGSKISKDSEWANDIIKILG